MAAVKPRGSLERMVLEKLAERGWEVHEAKRDKIDLDLSVSFGQTRGSIRFRNAFDVPKGVASAESSPSFLRIDLGQPAGEPSRWAVWDHYKFPTGKSTPRYWAQIYHEAIGADWASVAGCSAAPQQSWYGHYKVVETMLLRAEALAPSQDEDARREQIFLAQRRNFSVQYKRGKEIATTIVGFAVGALCGVALYFSLSTALANAKNATQTMAAGGFISLMFGIPGLALTILGITALRRLLLRPRKPLEGMDAVALTLRGTRAFSEVTLTPKKVRDGLALVVRQHGYLDEVRAPLSVGRLSASSSTHPVKVEADLCRIDRPEGSSAEAKLVPDHWLTVELSGAQAELRKLPPGPREERRREVVRWTFTGEEIDAGDVESLFLRVTSALRAGGAAYR